MPFDRLRLKIYTISKGCDGKPGTGLGLIICKDFIDKHKGSKHVEREEGNRSTFYYTLPLYK